MSLPKFVRALGWLFPACSGEELDRTNKLSILEKKRFASHSKQIAAFADGIWGTFQSLICGSIRSSVTSEHIADSKCSVEVQFYQCILGEQLSWMKIVRQKDETLFYVRLDSYCVLEGE